MVYLDYDPIDNLAVHTDSLPGRGSLIEFDRCVLPFTWNDFVTGVPRILGHKSPSADTNANP